MCRRIPGVSVRSIHTIGQGIGDLILGYKGKNYLIEVKDGSKSASRKKLTPDEERFHKEWTGQICIVENIDDIIDLLKTA